MILKRLLTGALLLGLLLTAGCAAGMQQDQDTWTLKEEKVVTFSDGESADLWWRDYSVDEYYKLADGTTLLIIQQPSGPENVSVAGVESFADLGESAQKAVLSYYDERGLLYDTQAELEKAYAEYRACKESGTEYHKRRVSQDVAPTASNDKIMCFITSVLLPVGGQTVQELRLGAVFDRETGEVISNWDLFTLPEQEARQMLLDVFDADAALRAEMEAALRPEYIILFPDNLEVTFPQGTLPSQEHSYGFGLDYEEYRDALQSWAIPDNLD